MSQNFGGPGDEMDVSADLQHLDKLKISEPLNTTSVIAQGQWVMVSTCWTCTVLNKQCDERLPCKQCFTEVGKLWQIGCHRGRFQDLINEVIPDMALGNGEWFLPGKDNTAFRITTNHNASTANSIFRDFRSGTSRVTALSQPAIPLLDFLEQFHDVNSRWEICYEEMTVDIIRQCALFQTALLSRVPLVPADPSSDGLILIALSLRCLVLTHEISVLESRTSYMAFENSETYYHVAQEYGYPSIDIWRLSALPQAGLTNLEQRNREGLPSMLGEVLQTIQNVMFRRRPEDWPMLLCALCLLRLILMNLRPFCPWMQSLTPMGQAMSSVNSVLCRLFEMCSQGYHPFSDDWKCEDYAALVNNDELLVSCFEWINDMWLDVAPEHDKVPADYNLEKRIDDFTKGYKEI